MPNLRLLRIPQEMRERRQWAVATLSPKADGKLDKAPINPLTGRPASSTDPSSWCSFEEAMNSGYPAVGYMLSVADPFTIIDLDHIDDAPDELVQRQFKIYETFDTYAERSQSGKGVHIITRARINGGTRRDGVEVYDQERFMICTGDVCRDAPIRDYQDLMARMVEEMGGVRTEADLPESKPERYTDAEIIEKLTKAKNGDKFKDLYYRTPGEGDDWSHRDASLAQMIAFYTRNHDQALRLFRGSALYRPHAKGKNPAHYESYYLMERTFGRAWRAEMARDADLDHGKRLVEQLKSQKAETVPPADGDRLPMPPGLVGEIAQFILGAAQRPVPEIAIAGALTFCSGIFGRQYNVSNTGLNLYLVLLAATGRGKEGAAAGIDMLMASLRSQMPVVDEFRGPGHIASGQGLVKHIDGHPSSFSFLSEFGHILSIITSPKANAADLRTKQVLLDLFSKSGQHQTLHSSVYADTDKNTKSVQAPCFSFMGDTTPEGYYDKVDERLVGEGLIPRFQTITYDGPRVPRNKAPVVSPSQSLQDRLVTIFTSIANMQHSNTFVDVLATDAAQAELDRFDVECDERINGTSGMAEMWNRAHLKVLRIAALLAVGRNHFEPRIDLEDVNWARLLVVSEIENLEKRISEGRVGGGEVTFEGKVADAVKDYLAMDAHRKRNTYRVAEALIDKPHLIPYGYFRRRLKNHSEFKDSRIGLVGAIKSALNDAVELGLLTKLTDQQVAEVSLSGGGVKPIRAGSEIYAIGEEFQ